MRFYVPEWDDAVDADYDFVNDELSTLHKPERDRSFIWDLFKKDNTPIDGVLISREQVESSQKKLERLTEYGIYDDPNLSVPDWLPTISDCGAWGYKSLPFPPYGNEDMLQFYDSLGVAIGVTIDHLVLGSGKEKGRLYLDQRAFGQDFQQANIPDHLTESIDIMVDDWPAHWPQYVHEHEPSVVTDESPDEFVSEDFEGSLTSVLDRLESDPRAVYREDDKRFRYNLTIENAREMLELYESGEYSFRLMAAFQGWDPSSYREAARQVLEMGYDYLGVGGVAGSSTDSVRDIVTEIGNEITDHNREQTTRTDVHVFGFSKPNAFDSVGRSGMSSFDSASMLRAAWTGGNNYHLDHESKFDAIRVRYPSPGSDLEVSIETALRGQEVHCALRAYDEQESIVDVLDSWSQVADEALNALPAYLRANRQDERYQQSRLRDLTEEFRSHFEYGVHLKGAFGGDFRKRLVKLLREDDPEDPIPFRRYEDVIRVAERKFTAFPRHRNHLDTVEKQTGSRGTFRQLWVVLEDYAQWIGDTDLLEGYRRTLQQRPWDHCDCPICQEYGIEVAIFRGNDRNRRRGFHNTHRFYKQFREELPRILVVAPISDNVDVAGTKVEQYLSTERSPFWHQVHDLPVVEVGAIHNSRVYEWWDTFSDDATETENKSLTRVMNRYDALFIYELEDDAPLLTDGRLDGDGYPIHRFTQADELREGVLDYVGYDSEFLPTRTLQTGLGEF